MHTLQQAEPSCGATLQMIPGSVVKSEHHRSTNCCFLLLLCWKYVVEYVEEEQVDVHWESLKTSFHC